MFCPNCGKEIPDTSKVCGFCGNKIPVKVEVPPPAPQSEPKPESKPVTSPQPENQKEVKSATPPPSQPKPAPPVVEKPKAKPGTSPGMPIWAWGLIGAVVIAGAVFIYAQFLAPTPQSVFLPNFCELDQITNTAKADVPIELYYGSWGALGYELAEDNMDHMTIRLLVDGQTVSGKRQKAIPSAEIPCGYNVLDKYDGAYWSFHKVTLSSLSVGEHNIFVSWTYDTEITDGFDSDSDGHDDYYGPGNKTAEYTITVVP